MEHLITKSRHQLPKNLFLTFGLALILGGCATPDVINVRQAGDKALTCEQITEEIADAETFKEKARDAKGVTGTNAAALVFFWPALLATYANAEEAIDAAQDRIDFLYGLGDDKGCG